MTVKHMKVFSAVYQEKSMTRAAEKLHMTQPAVTRAIHEIENHYGVRLFERLNNRLYSTPLADDIYVRALHILDTFDGIEKELSNNDALGAVRIGTSITIGNMVLIHILKAFQERYPNIVTKVKIAPTKEIEQRILDGKTDIGIVEGRIFSEYIHTEELMRDRLCLVLPPEHPLCRKESISLGDVAEYPLLLREKGSAGRTCVEFALESGGYPCDPRWESVSTQALLRGVAAGFGISILPEQLVEADVRAGTVVRRELSDAPFSRINYIAYHKQKYLSPALSAFLKICYETVGQAKDGGIL